MFGFSYNSIFVASEGSHGKIDEWCVSFRLEIDDMVQVDKFSTNKVVVE